MTTEPELLNERLERLAMVLDGIMPHCALLVRDALELLKEQDAEIKQLNRFVNGFSRDAMPVVRCKDCKQSGIDSTSYPQYWCSAHSEYHDGDWYCADGERKESW